PTTTETSTTVTTVTSTTVTTIFAGPSFPPDGGNVSYSFTPNTPGAVNQAGGVDVALFTFSPTTWTARYWGPYSGSLPAAGLDGQNHVMGTFAISGGGTIATWDGTTSWTDPSDMTVYNNVPIRFTLTMVSGGLTFVSSTSIIGLDPGVGT